MRSVSSATGPEGAATGSAARAASRSGSWRLSRAANDESVVTGPPRSTALRTVIVALLGLVAVHAITTPTFGGPEALTWAEVPDLSPGAGEVLIDVAASAVNRADLLQRQGLYSPPPGASDIIGLECSGTVAALGTGVTEWSVGDEVCALLTGGGYAEQVVVPAGQVLPVPQGMDVVTAAALPEVVCTVWSNVFMLGALQPGQAFLVHGGASGVGTMAIQLPRRAGATVFCTAGTPEKLARCRELGAHVAVNYKDEDFVARV